LPIRQMRSLFWYPHAQHSLDEAKNLSTCTKCLLFHRHWYSICRNSSPKDASNHDLACLFFASDFKFKSSTHNTSPVALICETTDSQILYPDSQPVPALGQHEVWLDCDYDFAAGSATNVAAHDAVSSHPAVVSRPRNCTTIGTDKIIRLQHGIESHNFFFSNRNLRCRHFKLGHQRYKPVPNGGAFERRALRGQIYCLRLAPFNVANPRDIEIAIPNFDSLRDAKRLPSRFLLLKLWELRPAW
jgi:hypothetical protein